MVVLLIVELKEVTNFDKLSFLGRYLLEVKAQLAGLVIVLDDERSEELDLFFEVFGERVFEGAKLGVDEGDLLGLFFGDEIRDEELSGL